MERFQELREIAEKKVIVADHMLTQTYNVVHEPKMLYFVLENVFLSMSNNMTAVLEYEKTFKRVANVPESFESKLNLFATKVVPRYNINPKYVDVMRDIKDLIMQQKNSPVEFSRKDKFVICDDDFKCKTLAADEIKVHIQTANQFINDCKRLFSDEKIFEAKK